MKKVLYRSADIRREIAHMFASSKGRRVAIAAFVGEGAEAFLRKHEGIELICWPQEGGTNPNAIRELVRRKVKVSFADRLHMKVYWTEDRGAIITSANLSTNALGAGDLREIGVRLRSQDIDINRIIASLNPRPVSVTELRGLERRHKLYVARNRRSDPSRAQHKTFADWYDSRLRAEWKLYSWYGYEYVSKMAREVARKEYGAASFHWSIAVRGGDYREADWILCYRVRKNLVTELGWMYANFVVRVPRSDKQAYDHKYPFELVQVWQLRRYEPPPFHLDARFKSAFRSAASEYGLSKLDDLKRTKPPQRLIDLIHTRYNS
ncbi:MAG: hypothetical protein LC785_14460 [Acidobacteria bacterium]|nr:hypothetical protein [Acidobacteriota bacterium]MCA1643114.1 hypothetical protein [Acidobacteriota bacterium]